MRRTRFPQDLPRILVAVQLLLWTAVFAGTLLFPAPFLPVLLFAADFPASYPIFFLAGVFAGPAHGTVSAVVWAVSIGILGAVWYYALGCVIRHWLKEQQPRSLDE